MVASDSFGGTTVTVNCFVMTLPAPSLAVRMYVVVESGLTS